MTSLSINLPKDFSSKVKLGDKILVGQVIANKNISGVSHEINIGSVLGVPASDAGKFLIKKPGDRVEESTVIALKKKALGSATKAFSPATGTVFKFDQESGVLTIRTNSETSTEDLFSPVDGVVELCDNDKIVVKTQKGGVIVADSANGEENIEGLIFAIEDSEVNPIDINADVAGKIIAGNKFDREALAKSIGIGTLGVIACEIIDGDLEELKKKMIKTPVLIVSHEEIKKIIKANGKKAHIDPLKKTILIL